jgi:hypothetical protein
MLAIQRWWAALHSAVPMLLHATLLLAFSFLQVFAFFIWAGVNLKLRMRLNLKLHKQTTVRKDWETDSYLRIRSVCATRHLVPLSFDRS